MPVEQIRAFKSTRGALFETKRAALEADARDVITKLYEHTVVRHHGYPRASITESWIVDNAAAVCAALAPLAAMVEGEGQ